MTRLLWCVSAAALLLVLAPLAVLASYDHSEAAFAAFERKHNKRYPTLTHRLKAYQNFVLNSERAKEMQRLNPKATFGVTRFADMSPEEFRAFTKGGRSPANYKARRADTLERPLGEVSSIPNLVNWTKAGAMGDRAPNQGQCGGGCVAYTVAINVAAVNFVTNGRYVELSAGETVECAVADGCDGGWMKETMQWFLNHTKGHIATAESYPWNSSSGSAGVCREPLSKYPTGAVIKSIVSIPHSESAMAAAVATRGPISIAADSMSWQLYTGGILTKCPANEVDTAVVIAGYDLDDSTPYWYVQNSWGSGWGEEGYLKIAKGSDLCGITSHPVTVEVEKN